MTDPAISYWAMHRRLAVLRGPASRQRCGCGATAVGWCYDGTDPSEDRDPVRGHRYSLDPTRYQARCRSCRRQAIARHPPPSDARSAAMVARYQAGESLARIADEFGVGRAAVRATLVTSGVTIRPPRSQTAVPVDAERAVRLYEAGVSLRGIAAVLGVGVPAARAAVTEAGLTIRPPGRGRLRSHPVTPVALTTGTPTTATPPPRVTFRPLPAISRQAPRRPSPTPRPRTSPP